MDRTFLALGAALAALAVAAGAFGAHGLRGRLSPDLLERLMARVFSASYDVHLY